MAQKGCQAFPYLSYTAGITTLTHILFVLSSSWCEAREEVGPDATQKRQFVGQKVPKKTRIPGSVVLEYKLHVQISTFGALWAKLPYLFLRNTLANGFFQKWKSLYYGGILGVLKKSD